MTTNDELEQLFRAERAVAPPASAAAHGWQRLTQDLLANAPAMSIATGPLKAGLWLVPKWIVAGFALGLVGTGAVAAGHSPKAASESPAFAVVHAAAPGATIPVSSALPRAELKPAPAALPTVGHSAPLATPLPEAPASSPGPTTFDAEFRLISRAKAELDARDFAAARVALDEHAVRFPAGVFAIERDALRVLAGCMQGPRNERSAAAFAQRHPGSPLVERVERACGPAAESGSNSARSETGVGF